MSTPPTILSPISDEQIIADLTMRFVGKDNFLPVALTCRRFRNSYTSTFPGSFETNPFQIACLAARQGRIGTIQWTINVGFNILANVDQRDEICEQAARGGHVFCFNFINHGRPIKQRFLAAAAEENQLPFLRHYQRGL